MAENVNFRNHYKYFKHILKCWSPLFNIDLDSNNWWVTLSYWPWTHWVENDPGCWPWYYWLENGLEFMTLNSHTGEWPWATDLQTIDWRRIWGEVSAEDVVEGERFCVRFVRFRILRRKLRTCRNKREGISVGYQPPACQPYWGRPDLGTLFGRMYSEIEVVWWSPMRHG